MAADKWIFIIIKLLNFIVNENKDLVSEVSIKNFTDILG